MAKVTIAGLGELNVHHVDEPGSFRVDMELARVGAESDDTKSAVENFRKFAALIHCYVGHNEGVTVDRLLEVLPSNVGPIMEALRTATGRKVVSKGEAAAPETRK